MRKDYNLEKRKYVIGGFIVVIVAIYVFRLFNLQVADAQYKDSAQNNALLYRSSYPSRGQIYDRNDSLVVYNEPVYDLVFVPMDVEPFDTVDLCATLRMSRREFDDKWTKLNDKRTNRNYSLYTQQTLMQHLTPDDYGRIQEKLYKYPGFYIVQRIIRQYNYHVGANILGNIREVNDRDLERDSAGYYAPGDYTGDLGVEKSYERWLRGRKGKEILFRDAVGKIKGRYKDGAMDVAPIAGNDLKLSIDIELQQFGEHLMEHKIGAIVAIEPKTGEVLALVTSPNYDPALLVGKERGKNYGLLSTDKNKPLFDRSIQAAYPPGSTFKPTQGLIFLQEGVVDLSTTFPCARGFHFGGMKVGCHGHGSPIALKPALQTSCNAYFCWGLKRMLDNKSKYGSTAQAFDLWKRYMVSMGYGYRLDIDLPGESRGFIPNVNYYDKMRGKDQWSALSIISISIGQGEILATPLQIANLSATIANRGYFYTPHVVKEIVGEGILKRFTERHYTMVDTAYYRPIVEGMRMAVTGGTCRKANIPGLEVCGKTGTAQNPHGKDHSVFMGFAPMNDPKIAICVFVENAGFGASFGVPIGALMIERYLNGDSPGLQSRANAMAATWTMTRSSTMPTTEISRGGDAATKPAGGKPGATAPAAPRGEAATVPNPQIQTGHGTKE